jgi:hypothetical protein
MRISNTEHLPLERMKGYILYLNHLWGCVAIRQQHRFHHSKLLDSVFKKWWAPISPYQRSCLTYIWCFFCKALCSRYNVPSKTSLIYNMWGLLLQSQTTDKIKYFRSPRPFLKFWAAEISINLLPITCIQSPLYGMSIMKMEGRKMHLQNGCQEVPLDSTMIHIIYQASIDTGSQTLARENKEHTLYRFSNNSLYKTSSYTCHC